MPWTDNPNFCTGVGVQFNQKAMQNTTWAQIHLHSGGIISFTNYILSFLLTLFLSVLNAQLSITVADISLFEIMSIILFIYITIYFLISVSSELLGKEGTDECS